MRGERNSVGVVSAGTPGTGSGLESAGGEGVQRVTGTQVSPG